MIILELTAQRRTCTFQYLVVRQQLHCGTEHNIPHLHNYHFLLLSGFVILILFCCSRSLICMIPFSQVQHHMSFLIQSRTSRTTNPQKPVEPLNSMIHVHDEHMKNKSLMLSDTSSFSATVGEQLGSRFLAHSGNVKTGDYSLS